MSLGEWKELLSDCFLWKTYRSWYSFIELQLKQVSAHNIIEGNLVHLHVSCRQACSKLPVLNSQRYLQVTWYFWVQCSCLSNHCWKVNCSTDFISPDYSCQTKSWGIEIKPADAFHYNHASCLTKLLSELL